MKALVVADSAYGNTWEIARAIAGALDGGEAVRVEEARPDRLEGVQLLVVGSPTQGGRPLPSVQKFVERLGSEGLRGVEVTAFDTRVDARKQGLPLRLLLGVIGYAAPRIGKALERHGGRMVMAPEGFIVEGKEGPLRAGEVERAAEWARRLPAAVR